MSRLASVFSEFDDTCMCFCIRSTIGNRKLEKFVYSVRCWLQNTEPVLTLLMGTPLCLRTGLRRLSHLYVCYVKSKRGSSFVCLLRVISFVKYTVNCMGLCHVFVCSLPFELLNSSHPRIPDLTTLELTTLTLKLFSLISLFLISYHL